MFSQNHKQTIVVSLVLLLFVWSIFGYTIWSERAQQTIGYWLLSVPVIALGGIFWLVTPLWREKEYVKPALAIVILNLIMIVVTVVKTSPTPAEILFLSCVGPQIFVLGYVLPKFFDESYQRNLLSAIGILLLICLLACLLIICFEIKEINGYKLFFTGYTPENFTRYSVFRNRNYEASFVQWLPALGVYLAQTAKNGRGRSVWYIIAFVALIHVVLTFSRSALLASAISLIPLLFYGWKKSPLVTVGSFVSLVGGVVLILLLSDFGYYKFFQNPLSMRDRDAYWVEVVQVMKTDYNWLTGVGYRGYLPQGYLPHNGFLTQILFFGVVGFVLWGGLVVERLLPLLRRLLNKDALSEPGAALEFSILGALAAELFGDKIVNPLYFTSFMFWLYLSGLHCSSRLASR